MLEFISVVVNEKYRDSTVYMNGKKYIFSMNDKRKFLFLKVHKKHF